MSKAATKRVSRVAMGVAAIGVATTVAGVAATQPASISAPLVDLAALIVVGSSTHPDGSGNEDFFHGMFDAPPYNTGDNLEHVNFFTGPFGINQALQAHDGEAERRALLGLGRRQREFAAHAAAGPERSRPAANRLHPGQQRRPARPAASAPCIRGLR